jgi:hypothetical protein
MFSSFSCDFLKFEIPAELPVVRGHMYGQLCQRYFSTEAVFKCNIMENNSKKQRDFNSVDIYINFATNIEKLLAEKVWRALGEDLSGGPRNLGAALPPGSWRCSFQFISVLVCYVVIFYGTDPSSCCSPVWVCLY